MADQLPSTSTAQAPDWERLATTPAFRSLISAKRRFIIPAVLFFIAYYLALPILVGYFPDLMKRRVLGPLNLAYVFALSEFVMTWTLAGMYMRRAARFDEMAADLVSVSERSSK